MLNPMVPLIPSRNGNFGQSDSATGHLLPFTTPHLRQFAPMSPMYSSGIFSHHNNLRLVAVVRSNLLEELRTRKSRKLELTVS